MFPDKKTVAKRISTTRLDISKKRMILGTNAEIIDRVREKLKDKRTSEEEKEILRRGVMTECFPELLHAMELSIDCLSVVSEVMDEEGKPGKQRISVADSCADSSDCLGFLTMMLNEIGQHFGIWKDENGVPDPLKYTRMMSDDDNSSPRKVRKDEDYISDEEVENFKKGKEDE
jgi:hypothetical protein